VHAWQTWDQNFGPFLGPLPPVIRSPCCGEFVVARERIMAHPRRAVCPLEIPLLPHLCDWVQNIYRPHVRDSPHACSMQMFAALCSTPRLRGHAAPMLGCLLFQCMQAETGKGSA
jgi:hypothetical protein